MYMADDFNGLNVRNFGIENKETACHVLSHLCKVGGDAANDDGCRKGEGVSSDVLEP